MAELQAPASLQEIKQKVDSIHAMLVSMAARLEYQLTPPEERAKMQLKAKEIFEKLKKEAEDEIAHELEKRRERGIGKEGDAVTEEDIKTLDSY